MSVIDFALNRPGGIAETIGQYNSSVAKHNLRLHCRWSKQEIDDFVKIVVPHAVGNVRHAQPSFAIVTSRADSKYLHFIVTDNGMGIPNLIRRALADRIKSLEDRDSALIEYFAGEELVEKTIRELLDSALVVASTAKHVSSEPDPDRRRGLGLFYLKQLTLERGGELRIRSGRAVVTFGDRKRGKQGDAYCRDGLIDSPGTSVRVVLPLFHQPTVS
jgi:hypothetical protein